MHTRAAIPSIALALTLLAFPTAAFCERKPAAKPEVPHELLVNAIVASVDGKPITLQDVAKRLSPPRSLTLKEASLDPEANAALDGLIMESLVLQEAEAKKLSVSDEEIDDYMTQVAQRNNLSRDGFEKALKQEGKELQEYRNFVKVDILKSRLASNLMQSGVGVTGDEVEEYIKEHPELSSSGAKVKLAHITVNEAAHGEHSSARINEALEHLRNGESFAKVAKAYSDSPDAAEGGLLGIIATKDLSGDIFEAVSSLKPDELSAVIHTPQGLQVFQVVERFADSENEQDQQRLRDEVRKNLQRQKLEHKMNTFFSAELMKTHAVDRKI